MNHSDKLMKKMTFTIWAEGEGGEDASQPLSFTFIYGIGTEGLSDFERAVSDLNPGDSMRVAIPPGGLSGYLGPLSALLGGKMVVPDSAGPLTLVCEFTGLGRAEPREVVTAIAQMQKAGGCASGCGCGCGGH